MNDIEKIKREILAAGLLSRCWDILSNAILDLEKATWNDGRLFSKHIARARAAIDEAERLFNAREET